MTFIVVFFILPIGGWWQFWRWFYSAVLLVFRYKRFLYICCILAVKTDWKIKKIKIIIKYINFYHWIVNPELTQQWERTSEKFKSKRFDKLIFFFFPDLFRRWLQPWVGWHHLLASQPTWSAGLSKVSRLRPRLQPQRCTKTPSHNRIGSFRRWIWAAGRETVWWRASGISTSHLKH